MPDPVAPPGPPPQNYRPPGQPAWGPPSPLANRATTPPPPSTGPSAGATIAIAVVTLLFGVVIGFFIGRNSTAPDTPNAAPPLTSPSTTSTSRPPGDTIAPNPTPSTVPGAPSTPTTLPQIDIAPATIGTFDDPIPIGQAYILGLYEITVVSVDRNATQTLADLGGPPPPAGSDNLIVEVRLRFTDEGFGRAAAIPFFVTDGVSAWTDLDATCGPVPNSILDAGLIDRDEETVTNTCFTVPTDAIDAVVFATEGFAGPVYFALR